MPQLPLVKQIDHLMIEVDADAETFSRFVSLWTDLLGLPLAFPLTQNARDMQMVFNSVVLFAGNTFLELYQLAVTSPDRPLSTHCMQTARLYGIAFDPQAEDLRESLQELNTRHIPYLPPIPAAGEPVGRPANRWTMVWLGDFLGSDLTRMQTLRQDQFLFALQTVFSRGLFFLCQWSRAYQEQVRVPQLQQLQVRERLAASPLGLVGVQEIVVGAANVEKTRETLQRLFAPREPEVKHPDVWRFEDGPAMRLVADTEDRLAALVFQVRSLEQARNVLQQHALLDTKQDNAHLHTLMLDATALLGLEIRLTE